MESKLKVLDRIKRGLYWFRLKIHESCSYSYYCVKSQDDIDAWVFSFYPFETIIELDTAKEIEIAKRKDNPHRGATIGTVLRYVGERFRGMYVFGLGSVFDGNRPNIDVSDRVYGTAEECMDALEIYYIKWREAQ